MRYVGGQRARAAALAHFMLAGGEQAILQFSRRVVQRRERVLPHGEGQRPAPAREKILDPSGQPLHARAQHGDIDRQPQRNRRQHDGSQRPQRFAVHRLSLSPHDFMNIRRAEHPMRQVPRFSFGTGLAPQARTAAVPNGARAPPLRTIFRIDARISHSPYRAPANANRRRFDHTLTHGSRRPYPQAARISAVSGNAYVFAFMAISRVVHHATALNEQTAAIRRSNRQYIAAILPCQAIPRSDARTSRSPHLQSPLQTTPALSLSWQFPHRCAQ